MKNISWIALDWGTSNLRLWAMSSENEVLAEKRSDQGMAKLKPIEFEVIFLEHASDWLKDKPIPVFACGMVGAKQGWQEAPYIATPCPAQTGLTIVKTQDKRIQLHIVSGVCQADPADVMRGEENQIAGFLTKYPNYQGYICLPGTHSKWAYIQDSQIKHFQTAMTGELFDSICQQTVLRYSLGEWSDAAFLDAAHTTISRPEGSLSSLFSVRAKDLLTDTPNYGKATISGTLIGMELAAMRNIWQNHSLTIVGASELARLYQLALSDMGIHAHSEKGSNLTLLGLIAAYQEYIS